MGITRDTLFLLKSTVNGTGVLDCTAELDFLGATPPCATIQQLPGDRWQTRYINGGGIHEQPFAVIYRTAANDTAGRVEAAESMYALADALEALGAVAGLGTITGADSPSLIERDGGGVETWRMSFMLESEVQ